MSSIQLIADYCDKHLLLKNAKLAKEYFYNSLPLCVIDAVFSINIKYSATAAVVERYCNYFSLKEYRKKESFPDVTAQESISDFLSKKSKYNFAENIFNNRCRTSSKNGILKAEAVFLFASVLQKYGIEYFQDIYKIYDNDKFALEIKNIPGQKSGISLNYFLMLSGDDNLIKPDRQIIGFLEDILKHKIEINEAQILLSKSCAILKSKYPNLSPRLLDYQIWNYQRNK